MQTIHKYPLREPEHGIVTIRMPEHCVVLGLSNKGFLGIAVRGDHDPERLVPKKFVVVSEGKDAAIAAGHRYIGDILHMGVSRPILQYVFEWIDPREHLGDLP